MTTMRPIDTAPRDGTMFLVDDGHLTLFPCFRSLRPANEDGDCADNGGWVIVAGCPDDGGEGVQWVFVPDREAGSLTWRYLPRGRAARAVA